MKNVALIMAAGNSQRCGFNKLVAQLGGQTVLEQCLRTFIDCETIDEIWIIGKAEVDLKTVLDRLKDAVKAKNSKNNPNQGRPWKVKGVIKGSDSRFKSVTTGINHCAKHYDKDVRILVHNAANPHLSKVDLEAGLKLAEAKQNVIFGFFSPNSIKQVGENGQVAQFLNREEIFETQTPQISTLHTFTKALEAFQIRTLGSPDSIESGLNLPQEPRDEAELLALINEPIHVYECDTTNTKITFASDLVPPLGSAHLPLIQGENIRIGLGEDSHRFAREFILSKPFRLGGIDVSAQTLSSDGNSDGDVILHALCNALLSAYGDKTFDPIAAPICKAGDTNSVSYLNATLEHLKSKSATLDIKQILISLEGARPRIAPQHEAIVNNLAMLLKLNAEQIGLTYTTGEALTECGKGLGMRSYVLVTINN